MEGSRSYPPSFSPKMSRCDMLLYINPCKAGVYVNENIEIERSSNL